MMTKKDYELIAATLKGASDLDGGMDHETSVSVVARELANALAQTSPRFDRERFLRACQPESVRNGR